MPALFRQKWQPEITLEMQLKNEKLSAPPVAETQKKETANIDAELVEALEESATKAQPKTITDVGVASSAAAAEYYEVVLNLNITAKQESLTVLTIELQQAGIFALQGFTEEEKKHLLDAYCPNILFPYARKIISDMTVEASLPPLLLTPIDFEAVYRDQLRKKIAQEKEPSKNQ